VTVSIAQWESPFPFDDIHELGPDNEDGWRTLELMYSREGSEEYPPIGFDRPLYRCLEVARELGAYVAVTETRYMDIDYRSEYSAFYSRAFEHFEESTRRIHFFSVPLDDDAIIDLVRTPQSEIETPSERSKRLGYLGYMIVRPQVHGVVGRTMLKPPESLRHSVRTAVKETVNFFGQELEVRAVPFIQQDARLGSCAHAASWMCHHSAYLGKRGVSRRAIADFSAAVDPGLGVGLPPVYYEVDYLQEEDRPAEWQNRSQSIQAKVARVCCRYMNSKIPVLVVMRVNPRENGEDALHAVTVCGYKREDELEGGVSFIINDDRRGPYLTVKNVLNDRDESAQSTFAWSHILAPLPEKLWMTGEAAERQGSEALLVAAREALDKVPSAQILLKAHEDENLVVRCYAITSSGYKQRLYRRCIDPNILEAIAFARLPQYVWVVEAIDRTLRGHMQPAVLGEVVIDATSDSLDPVVLATRLPGVIAVPTPDDPQMSLSCTDGPLQSGGEHEP